MIHAMLVRKQHHPQLVLGCKTQDSTIILSKTTPILNLIIHGSDHFSNSQLRLIVLLAYPARLAYNIIQHSSIHLFSILISLDNQIHIISKNANLNTTQATTML